MQDPVKNSELVSALVDGQLRPEEFAEVIEWVGSTEDARATWHAYHLVGDVMRSSDALAGGVDAVFMARLRQGLQRETASPAVQNAINLIANDAMPERARALNLSDIEAANDSRYRWRLVAGIVSLALVSLIGWQGLGPWADQSGTVRLAQGSTPVTGAGIAPQQDTALAEPQVMIRDPQLDALLAAHKQFGGTSALQMPAGFLRNATFEGAAR
ncbi:sigma-E factor negative regulatory protein [Rhodoferax sp.]|uniref:sigma-E factor negative regulatory protein n=1 Tax=Rhodoferax sp. TaxID=50421 RepID=UPI001ED24BDC|nr:sigma-E factor negative regulatory protein [Rhodoferax sp.]MBT9506300.1 sigma-E factor negative regulatory protein [Rhodoferax sp.]